MQAATTLFSMVLFITSFGCGGNSENAGVGGNGGSGAISLGAAGSIGGSGTSLAVGNAGTGGISPMGGVGGNPRTQPGVGLVQCGTSVCDARNPICDTTTNQCVECLTKTDCTQAGTTLCEPNSKECVQCLTASDCSANQTCNPQEFECVSVCATNADCANSSETPVCNPSTKTCVGCVNNSDCTLPASSICSAEGECVQCVSDDQCTPPETCSTRRNVCRVAGQAGSGGGGF
jgi:hypothetical protein